MRSAACTRARACACMVVSLREWSGQGGACCPSQRCGAAPLGWAAHAGAAEGPAHKPTCVVGAVGEAVVRRLRDHVRKVQPLNDAVQWCSAVQCSAAQRSAAQRSGVQPCAELCRARHTACSAALAVTTAARNQTLHTLFPHAAPQSERLHSKVSGSFRRFCRAVARSECGGGSTFPNMYLRGPPASGE